MSCDPAGTIDGLNLYAFVGGNPMKYTDAKGYMRHLFSVAKKTLSVAKKTLSVAKKTLSVAKKTFSMGQHTLTGSLSILRHYSDTATFAVGLAKGTGKNAQNDLIFKTKKEDLTSQSKNIECNGQTKSKITMLLYESTAFGKKWIRHQEIIIKTKTVNFDGKFQSKYEILSTVHPIRNMNKEDWKNYKQQAIQVDTNMPKIVRVSIESQHATALRDAHITRRKQNLEDDPSIPKVVMGFNMRTLTEYARGNVCTTHFRNTLDNVFGVQWTNRITKEWGLSENGLRFLNTGRNSLPKQNKMA